METPKNRPSDKPKPGLLGKILKKVISLPHEYMMHDMAIDHEIKELEKEQHEDAWHEVRHRKAEKLVHSGDPEKVIEGRNIMAQLRLEKKAEFKKSYENAGRKELLDAIEPLISRNSIRFNKTTGEVIVDKRLSDVERIEYGTILKLLADKAGKLKDHEQQELKERLIGEINRVAQIQNDAIREREVEDMDDTLKKAFLSDQSFFIGHKFAGIKKLTVAAKQEQLLKVYHFNTKMGIENTNVSDMSKDWLDSDFKENIMRGYVTNDQLDKLTQKFDPGQNNLTPQKRKAIYQSFLSRYGIMSFDDSSKIKEERDLYNLIVKFKKEQKDLYDEINRSINTELAFETDEENKEIEPPNPIGTLSKLNHGTSDFAVDKYEEVYKQIATEVNKKRKTMKEDTENAKRAEEEEKKKRDEAEDKQKEELRQKIKNVYPESDKSSVARRFSYSPPTDSEK